MSEVTQLLKQVLEEKLADSLSGPLPDSTARRIHGASSLPGKATAVIGMRRAGKTTFVHQLRRARLDSGALRIQLPYVNFEDERLERAGSECLSFLAETYDRIYPDARKRGKVMWCLDEIQTVAGWERFVRRLLDSGGNDVVVTGSSAALLSREIATSLRGRAWEVLIHPFGFDEVLRHSGHAIPERRGVLSGHERARVERAFLDWLETGGFPEAQGLDGRSRLRLLTDYVDVAMLRDVMERHGMGNVVGLRWLVRHLLANAAGTFSVEKFYHALKSQGIAISKDTVHHLLAHLEDCFLIRTVWMESDSERQRMVNPRKAYPVDPGLIPLYTPAGRLNTGHALETAVLVELERRGMSVTYVRSDEGYEVDFLAKGTEGGMELIQVCADASSGETAKRELRALATAGEKYSRATRRLLTLTRDGLPSEIPDKVVAQPAYEWILDAQAR